MEKIDITVPKGWAELDQRQLGLIFRLRALGYSEDAVRMIAFIEWGRLKVVTLNDATSTRIVLLRDGRSVAIDGLALAMWAESLRWLDKAPNVPVYLQSLRGKRGLDPMFQGVEFETFIACDNLWQGYVITHRDEMLDRLGAKLYRFRSVKELLPWERVAVAMWWSSLKEFLTLRFPEFFKPAADSTSLSSAPSPESVADAVNAQIRALTKGDVTKEKEVLATSTWRALSELNAQAREYRELKKISSKHGK